MKNMFHATIEKQKDTHISPMPLCIYVIYLLIVVWYTICVEFKIYKKLVKSFTSLCIFSCQTPVNICQYKISYSIIHLQLVIHVFSN